MKGMPFIVMMTLLSAAPAIAQDMLAGEVTDGLGDNLLRGG